MVKVTAVKPAFYNKWYHPGEKFDCDEKAAKKFENEGKVKIESKIIKRDKKK